MFSQQFNSMTKKSLTTALFLLFSLPFFAGAQAKLEKRALLNGRIELLVPVNFKPMTKEMMAIKYPNPGQQPGVVLTDENAEVNIVATFTPQPIQPSQVGQYKEFLMNSLKKSHPGAKWLEDGVKTVNGKNVGYFKMITPAADQNVFVYYFFTNMDARVLLLTFNCTETLLPKWKATAETIVASLKIVQ